MRRRPGRRRHQPHVCPTGRAAATPENDQRGRCMGMRPSTFVGRPLAATWPSPGCGHRGSAQCVSGARRRVGAGGLVQGQWSSTANYNVPNLSGLEQQACDPRAIRVPRASCPPCTAWHLFAVEQIFHQVDHVQSVANLIKMFKYFAP